MMSLMAPSSNQSNGSDRSNGSNRPYLRAHAESTNVFHRRGLEFRLPRLEIRAEHVALVLLQSKRFTKNTSRSTQPHPALSPRKREDERRSRPPQASESRVFTSRTKPNVREDALEIHHTILLAAGHSLTRGSTLLTRERVHTHKAREAEVGSYSFTFAPTANTSLSAAYCTVKSNLNPVEYRDRVQ